MCNPFNFKAVLARVNRSEQAFAQSASIDMPSLCQAGTVLGARNTGTKTVCAHK